MNITQIYLLIIIKLEFPKEGLKTLKNDNYIHVFQEYDQYRDHLCISYAVSAV